MNGSRTQLLALGLCLALAGSARPTEIAQGVLDIRGAVLEVGPATQEVDPGRPTVVWTRLGSVPAGEVPPSLRVVGELSGPGIADPIRLSAVPGEPLRIPGLLREGEYAVTGIRLEQDGVTVAPATPESVTVTVHRILVASVTSRRLTREEIAEAGIVVDGDDYTVWRYTVGFATASGTFEIPFELVRGPDGSVRLPRRDPLELPPMQPGDLDLPRPQVAPLDLDLTLPDGERPRPDLFPHHEPPTIPGFVVIPTDMAFLNQFFSVLVVVQNGALEGSGLTLRDITATLELTDDGLRPAETTPPTVPGEPVPVVDPGPDGELGTGDDLTFLVAQASGQAGWLVEGLEEGRHLVRVHLTGTLEGLATGEPVTLTGTVPGVVVVRDPRFALTFFHPWTVRSGETYTFRVLVTNLSTTRVDDLSLALPPTSLTGCRLADGVDPEVALGELQPGDAQEAAWRLVSLRTGRVVASAFNTSHAMDASFRFELGVGELGIPLSPESLVLPPEVDDLPASVRAPALELLGLAYSLANAPEGAQVDLPPVGEGVVVARGQELAGCARRAALGEPLDRALLGLGLAWLGAGRWNDGWDALRRASSRGHRIEEEMAGALARRMEAVGAGAALAELEELAITGRPVVLVRARDAGYGRAARLVVSGLGSGVGAAGQAADTTGFVRDLPGAAVLDVDGGGWSGELGVVVPPLAEDGSWSEPGYQVQLHGLEPGNVDLEVVVVRPDGSTLRYAVAGGVDTAAGSVAILDVPADGGPAHLMAAVQAGGPVTRDEPVPAAQGPRPGATLLRLALDPGPELNPVEGGPYRRVLALLSQPLDVDAAAGLDLSGWRIASHLELPLQDGSTFVADRERPVEAVVSQLDPHLVVLVAHGPLNPHAELTVDAPGGLPLAGGAALPLVAEPVATDPAAMPGGAVRGVVVGADGLPVPGASVQLYEPAWLCDVTDLCSWVPVLADETAADGQGRFVLDAVRYREGLVDPRGEPFTVRAVDPATGHEARAWGRLTADGEVLDMAVTMLGRGDVVGTLRREDGHPLAAPVVAARSVAHPDQGGSVVPDRSGRFRLRDLPVGPVQIVARDGALVTYATVTVPGPGQEVSVDLVLPAGAPAPTGAVEGVVLDGVTGAPVGGARVVAIASAAGGPVDVTVTAADGSFAFSRLPAGPARFEAYLGSGRPDGVGTAEVVADSTVTVQVVLGPPQEGSVTGTVYRRAGGQRTPAGGVYVLARQLGLYALTGADGSYRLDGVPLGDVSVEAVDPATGERASRLVTLTAAGQELVVDLELGQAAGAVEGYVLDRDGRPVAGAQVALDRFTAGGTVSSDGSGHFRIDGVPPGTHEVLARHGDRHLGRTAATVLYDGDVAAVTVTVGGTVSLTVRAVAATEGGGTADVAATFRYRRPGVDASGRIRPVPEEGWYSCPGSDGCWLDDRGHAHLEDLPEGVGSLAVVAENPFYGAAGLSEELDPSDDGRELVIDFSAPGSVEGRVVDGVSGQPVEGAVVELWWHDARGTGGQVDSAVTGADGSFTFGLVPAGFFEVRALWTQGAEVRVGWRGGTVTSGQAVAGVEVVLRPNGAAEGSVALCGGGLAPAQPGDTVHLVLEPSLAPRPFHDGTPEPPPLARRELDLDIGSGDASFAFAGLAAGVWSLTASSPLHGRAYTTFSVEGGGDPVAVGQLCLLPTGSISGRVILPETGEGVAGVPVQLTTEGPYGNPVLVAAATTAGDGSFTFPDLPLRRGYRAGTLDPATGRGAFSDPVRLCPAGDAGFGDTCVRDARVELELAPLGTVEGRLLTADGTGVGGAPVRLEAEVLLLGEGGGIESRTGELWAQTGADGSFRFDGVPAGPVTVIGWDPASPLRARAHLQLDPLTEPDTWVDLTLPATADVVAEVTDPAGAPLDGGRPVTLLLHQDSPGFGEPWGGGASLDRLAFTSPASVGWAVAGRYTVTACVGTCAYDVDELRAIGDRTRLAGDELGARLETSMPDPPVPASVTLRLVARAAAQVTVTDGGQPVSGAEVTVAGSGFYGPVRVVTQTREPGGSTDPIPDLGEGTYTVTAVATDTFGNRRRGVADLVIRPEDHGATVPVTVALEDAVAIHAEVLAADGTPAVGALVTLLERGGAGRRLQGVVGADGALDLPAVPHATTFHLEALEAGGGPGRFALDGIDTGAVAPGETLDLGTLRLDDRDPTAALADPLDGEQGVDPAVHPVVRFDELVRHGTLDAGAVILRPEGGEPLPVALTVADRPDPDGDGPAGPYTEVTLDPGLLESDTLYLVEVAGGVADLAGRTLGYPRHFTFHTADVTPPRVAASDPADDPGGVHPVGPEVTPHLVFSERVDAATLTSANVRLLDGAGTPVDAPPVPDLDGFGVTLEPTSALTLDTFYTIRVANVADLSGNTMSGEWTATFRVRDTEPPVATLLPPLEAAVEGDSWRVGEGRTVTLRASVSSNDAVDRVTFTLDGQSLGVGTPDPGSGEYRLVLADGLPPGTPLLGVTAVDVSGNPSVPSEHLLTVTDDAPPSGEVGVAPAGDVLPNHEVTVTVTATDDVALAEARVELGGVLSETRHLPLSGTSATTSTTVRLPSGAAAGDSLLIAVTVVDDLGQETPLAPHAVGVAADAQPPTATRVAPAPGSRITSGDQVALDFELADEVAVSSVNLEVDGRSVALTLQDVVPPGELWSAHAVGSWTAPPVNAPTDVPWTLTLVDPAGNAGELTGTFHVEPRVNPEAPVVTVSCPRDGDPALAGLPLTLSFQIEDDDLIYGYVARVGDEVIGSQENIDATSFSGEIAWTVPADAGSGEAFEIEIEAQDYASNVGTATVTVVVPAAVVLTGGGTLDASHDGQDLVLADGTYTVAGPVAPASLILAQGTVLTAPAGQELVLQVAGQLRVACGARVDASGLGYGGGTGSHREGYAPDGVTGAGVDFGGSHGGEGVGHEYPGPAGEVYGSVYAPAYGGGGGSQQVGDGPAGSGGGVVRLTAGSVVLEGEVRAVGEGSDGGYASPGAGGSVVIEAGSLSGGGVVDVSGGSAWFAEDGAGGGGRVAVLVDDLTGFDVGSQVVARGGAKGESAPLGYAGAGTVYVRTSGSTFGELIVDQGVSDGKPVALTPLPAVGEGTIGVVVEEGADAWVGPAEGDPDFALGVVGAWMEVGGTAYRVVGQQGRRLVLLEGAAGAVSVGQAYRGVYRFDGVTVRGGARVILDDDLDAGGVTVEPGSELIPRNQGPPHVDPDSVTLAAHDGRFWLAGAAGAVTDPDGLASVRAEDTVSGESADLAVGSDGAFPAVALAGAAGDPVAIVATDAHLHPLTAEVEVGLLPANAAAPRLDPDAITLAPAAPGTWTVTGGPGAAIDPEPPVTVTVTDLATGDSASTVAAADGSFQVALAASPGDALHLAAVDGHPAPRASELDLGTVPGNDPPAVDPAGIGASYVPPTAEVEAHYQLHIAAGAITDPDGPIHLLVSGPAGESWSATISSGAEAYLDLEGGTLAPGDVLELTATDSHPSEPRSTTVQLDPLPPDNYGPPQVDVARIHLLPRGLGYQVVGEPGAVVDPDAPVTVTLADPATGWTGDPVAVGADGSFWAVVAGTEGDPVELVAEDGHPLLPLATDPLPLGTLAPPGLRADPVDIGGHQVTAHGDGLAVLDGGSAVASVLLRSHRDDTDPEGLEEIVDGLAGVTGVLGPGPDAGWSLRGYALAGTDLLAWLREDGCLEGEPCFPPEAVPLTVTAGQLEAGIAAGGWLDLVADTGSLELVALPEPRVITDWDAGTRTVAWACGGGTVTFPLPATAGLHALAVVPGPPGGLAVVTDDPQGELRLVDLATPLAPADAGVLDLPGDSPPLWAAWEDGWLLLAREDLTVQLARWVDDAWTLEVVLTWAADAQPVGAAQVGGGLFVALADGRLQQIALDGVPSLLGEADLGEPLAGLEDVGFSLLAVTQGGALRHVWVWEMGPEPDPESVAWTVEGRAQFVALLGLAPWEADLAGEVAFADGWVEALPSFPGSEYTTAYHESDVSDPPVVRLETTTGVRAPTFQPTAWTAWRGKTARNEGERGSWYLAVESAPARCGATAGAWGLRVTGDPYAGLWTAVADPAGPVLYATEDWGDGTAATAELPAQGTVRALLGGAGALYIVDDGIAAVDLADPDAPVEATRLDPFGADPVAAAVRAETGAASWLVAAASAPPRLAVADLARPVAPVLVADGVPLPGLAGQVLDLAWSSGRLWVLARDGGAETLARYDLADPVNPVLEAAADVSGGAAATALAASQDLVAVAREDGTVDTYLPDTLDPLGTVSLPAPARDALGSAGGGASLALGAGWGIARLRVEPGGETGGPEVVVSLHPVPGGAMALAPSGEEIDGIAPGGIVDAVDATGRLRTAWEPAYAPGGRGGDAGRRR